MEKRHKVRRVNATPAPRTCGAPVGPLLPRTFGNITVAQAPSLGGAMTAVVGEDRSVRRNMGAVHGLALAVVLGAGCSELPEAEKPASPEPLFQTTALHRISIEVAPEHLSTLADGVQPRVPSTFTIDGRTIENVGIRRKGSIGSLRPLAEKPSFSVKLDEFVEDQKLDGFDKILLHNAVQDPSFLNEHLGYEVHRRAGIPAPRTSYARVTFNGEDKGLYVVREAIDRGFLRRHFGVHRKGNLFEGCCLDDFVTKPWSTELKHEIDENRSRARLEAFAAFVRDEPPETFAERLPQWVDVDGLLTTWAVEALLGHWDGFVYNLNNYYFYQHPVDDRFVFLPSGMDQLFQDACFDPGQTPMGRLARRMLEVPAFVEKLEQEIARVAGDPSDLDVLSARVEAVTARLHAEETTYPWDTFEYDRDIYDHQVERVLSVLAQRRLMLAKRATAVCGDGLVEGMEHCGCDDGNTISGDGCSAACVPEICGDGIVQTGEACDGDGCNDTCTGPAVCGNGVRERGERCDDGNTDPDDGCDACRRSCVPENRNGRRYAFCLQTRKAVDAQEVCLARGGVLATPESEEENRWVSARSDELGMNDYWLGATDHLEEGTWLTATGEKAAYQPWGPDQPDGATNQNCVMGETWHDGRWNDAPCDEYYAFVCRLL